MFVWFLILFAAVCVLIGLLVLKLTERIMYEHYRQSVPWDKLDIMQIVTTYSNELYDKFLESFFFIPRLLLTTTAIKAKVKRRTSFPVIKKIIARTMLRTTILLNHFLPEGNSSFVILASQFPIGIPRRTTKIPRAIFMLSCIINLTEMD